MQPQQIAHTQPPSEQCFTCSFTQEFHDIVLRSLGELGANSAAIIARLDKVNGSIAKLYERTDLHATQLAVLERAGSPPLVALRNQVDELDKKIATTEASKSGARKVISKLEPAIWMAVGMILFLILKHAEEIEKFLKL